MSLSIVQGFSKSLAMTVLSEIGDKTFFAAALATIGLAAAENPLGVVLGGILGQALCQTAAVFGGKSLATQISERFIALSGGILFIVFGIQSLFSTIES
nr:GDT1-like protein 4 [Tanacetum cinerariifolium]